MRTKLNVASCGDWRKHRNVKRWNVCVCVMGRQPPRDASLLRLAREKDALVTTRLASICVISIKFTGVNGLCWVEIVLLAGIRTKTHQKGIVFVWALTGDRHSMEYLFSTALFVFILYGRWVHSRKLKRPNIKWRSCFRSDRQQSQLPDIRKMLWRNEIYFATPTSDAYIFIRNMILVPCTGGGSSRSFTLSLSISLSFWIS